MVGKESLPEHSGINRRHLRVQDLKRLSHVTFNARRRIEGQYSGQHATPQSGQSVEFRDYRQYTPGDEVGSIDWKIYARSDRLFIKIFEHQADLTVHLLVDASNSMTYGDPGASKSKRWTKEKPTDATMQSKYDYACSLAAAIAFLITKQNDRVSVSMAQKGLSEFTQPGSSMVHLAGILDVMERVKPQGKAKLADAIRALLSRTRRRDLVIVFSDLLEDREEILKALAMGIHRGGEVILFHVMHTDELNLPQIENGLFIDSETGERLRVNVEDIRKAYAGELKTYLDGWSRYSKSSGVDYSLCSTADSYFRVLERYLTGRAVRI